MEFCYQNWWEDVGNEHRVMPLVFDGVLAVAAARVSEIMRRGCNGYCEPESVELRRWERGEGVRRVRFGSDYWDFELELNLKLVNLIAPLC